MLSRNFRKILVAVLALAFTITSAQAIYYDVPLILRVQQAELGMLTNLPDISVGQSALSLETSVPFVDCDDGVVTTAYRLGIVHGVGNLHFAPDATLTQAELAQMSFNAFSGESRQATDPWYEQATEWAGIDDPAAPATGLELITELYRCFCLGSGDEFNPGNAIVWATERQGSIDPALWDKMSQDQPLTRLEGVHAFLGLAEIS